MNAPIIVTGGNGQVAVALKRLSPDLEYKFLARSELDICDTQAVADCFRRERPSVVINTAAYTGVDDAESNPETARRVNELGPRILAKYCANSKTPLVHLSTDYVFNGESEIPYSEAVEPSPLGVYGLTKLNGEVAVKTALTEYVILRLSGIFSGHANCFPKSILKAALRLQELDVVDDQITGPTSARSAALVIDLIVRKILDHQVPWGTYHFAQRPFLTWFEFANMIIETAQKLDDRFEKVKINPVYSKHFGAQASRPKWACLESEKTCAAFNIPSLAFNREEDVSQCVAEILGAEIGRVDFR